MKVARVDTRCECQAHLTAQLAEGGTVISGSASLGQGPAEIAPANRAAVRERGFDIGWLCPFCGRNAVRTFYAGALTYRDA